MIGFFRVFRGQNPTGFTKKIYKMSGNKAFLDTAKQLETLIARLETNLGIPKSHSPLQTLILDMELKIAEAEFQEKHLKKLKEAENQQKKGNNAQKEQNQQKGEKKDQQKGEKKEAKDSKPAKPKQAPAPQETDKALADFLNVEFRVGEFQKAWIHPESEKLYCEEVNIGTSVRNIASGLQKFVKLEDMSGYGIVWKNLKEKKLAGFPSHGMMVCASIKEEGNEQVNLLRPADGSKAGDRVFLDGMANKFPEEEVVKDCNSKTLERVMALLKTDAEGFATYNGIRLATSSGLLKSSGIPNAHVG